MKVRAVWVLAATLSSSIVAAEPRVQMKLPAFPATAFPNFSSVVLPPNHGSLEVWLENALGEIQLSTIRVKLNDIPMTPFVGVNPLPRGFRGVIRQGVTLSPDYNLRTGGENILSFAAMDDGKVTYQGQFYLTVDPGVAEPRLAAVRSTPIKEVSPPPQNRPPQVSIHSKWPRRTDEAFLTLDAEVADYEGLRRVVIEVNGKDVEEILLENELPVRKRQGFMARSKLPGEVTGDGRRLLLSMPVKLGKDITVVAVRAENVLGLRSRDDRTVERVKK